MNYRYDCTMRSWAFPAIMMAALLAGPSTVASTTKANCPPSPPCNVRVAERATVRLVASNPKRYMGHCVTIDGTIIRGAFLDDVDGLYQRDKDILDPSSNGARLGLDNVDKFHRRTGLEAWSAYRRVTITGRVQDCETTRAIVQGSAGPGEITMTVGYCHTANGAYLWIEDLKVAGQSTFERQLQSSAGPDFGDLEPAPLDWQHRGFVEQQVERFLDAVRSGDRKTLANLHFEDFDPHDSEQARVLDLMLKDGRSPFSSLRQSARAPQTLILVRRSAPDDPDDEADYSSTICFCRTGDCTGRWPIASFDADNLATRPYACTTLGPYLVFRQGERPMFTTPISRKGLAEPARRTASTSSSRLH